MLKTEPAQTPIPESEYVTLCHSGTFATAEGDTYRLVTRLGTANWSARRLEKNRLSANFQGDPLWPQKILAPYKNLSAWFDLNESACTDHCILPDTATVNRQLTQLIGHSAGFRDLNLYPGFKNGSISEREYVDVFIDEGLLPMGEVDNRDSIHDWSYHFVSFLFPDYMLRVRENFAFIRDRLKEFVGDTNYAWNYYGHLLDSEGRMQSCPVEERMSHADAVYRQMAIALDVATAKPVQLLALERAGRIQNCLKEQQALAVFLSGVSAEAIQRILWLEPKRVIQAPSCPEMPNIMNYLHEQLSRLEEKVKVGPAEVERAKNRKEVLQFMAGQSV